MGVEDKKKELRAQFTHLNREMERMEAWLKLGYSDVVCDIDLHTYEEEPQFAFDNVKRTIEIVSVCTTCGAMKVDTYQFSGSQFMDGWSDMREDTSHLIGSKEEE